MIKKSFFILTTAVAMLFASCEKYDHAIGDLQDRLDKTEDFVLPTINEQITDINSSIDDLKAVDTELNNLIDNLEAKAADLQSQLDANAAADAKEKERIDKINKADSMIFQTVLLKDSLGLLK